MIGKNLLGLLYILCVTSLGAGLPAYAQGTPPVQVRVAPATAQVTVGQIVDVTVEVVDVEALYGADVALTFDPNVVEVVDADSNRDGVQVALGAFLESGFLVLNNADNTAGTVRFAMTQLNPSLPKSGTGALIVIKLRGKVGGRSPLTLTAVELARRDGTAIPSTLVSGAVDVTQAAPAPNSGPTQTPSATATSVRAQGPATLPTVTPSATPTSVSTQSPATTPTLTPSAMPTSLTSQGQSVTMQTLTPLPTSTPKRELPGSTSIAPATTTGPNPTHTVGPARAATQPTSRANPSPATIAPTGVAAAALPNPPVPAPTKILPTPGGVAMTGTESGSSRLTAPLVLVGAALAVAFITVVILVALVMVGSRRRKAQS